VGAALDAELMFSLDARSIDSELDVLADATDPAGNATRIRVTVESAAGGSGVRRGNLSISLPRLAAGGKQPPPAAGPGAGWAVWAPPIAPFTLLAHETSLDLRVVIDRSTIEVWGAGGEAVVSVRDFPAKHETAVRLRNEGTSGSLVLERALGWSMGCGWVG
jgi:hypothetical protein